MFGTAVFADNPVKRIASRWLNISRFVGVKKEAPPRATAKKSCPLQIFDVDQSD